MESPPRRLTDWLRTRSDDELVALLTARPDLAVPVPGDVDVLASRAGGRLSVARALEQLDRFTVEVAEAVVLLPDPTSLTAVRTLVGPDAPEAALGGAVDRLRTLALVWGPDEALRPVGHLRQLLGVYPAGLGRPVADCLRDYDNSELIAVADRLGLAPAGGSLGRPATPAGLAALAVVVDAFADPRWLRGLLDTASDETRELLGRVAAGPPLRQLDRTPTGVLRWLLDRALLVEVEFDALELPREVGLLVRGDRPLGPVHPDPPELTSRRWSVADVDAAATLQAMASVDGVAALLELWAVEPPAQLRAGGLGVRDLRRTARALDVPESTVALWCELAHAAQLVELTRGLDSGWLPTPAYDAWARQPPAVRWSVLAASWWFLRRLPGLVGQREGEPGRDRALAALSADLSRPGAPDTRGSVLGALAAAGAGAAPDAAALAALLEWRAPRRVGRFGHDVVRWTLAEAEVLGVTGRGALSTPGRALIESAGDGAAAAAAALAPLLPAPVDHVLLQADLTAVAPGRLTPELARELALVADVESSGGATVYRIREDTLRRALDAGRSAEELHELFRSRSRTPVPQALHYLVDDVARRHGVLRTGRATSYLRCDDAGLLTEVVAAAATNKRTADLRLRQLAPSVAISPAAAARLTEAVRALGYAPVGESPEGAVVISRPEGRRTPNSPRYAAGPQLALPDPAQLPELVRTLRRRDADATDHRRSPVVSSHSTDLARLQEAARVRRPLRVGYVDGRGQPTSRELTPIGLGGGFLRAVDPRAETTLTLALHRVIWVIDPDDARAVGASRDTG